MRQLGKWLAGLAVLVAAVIGVFAFVSYMNTHTWDQKLTVDVETPDGAITGASVTRVSKSVSSFVPGHPGGLGRSSLRGEAVVLEVMPGRYLIVLLGNLDHLAQKVLAAEIGLHQHSTQMPEFGEWAGALARLRQQGSAARTFSSARHIHRH